MYTSQSQKLSTAQESLLLYIGGILAYTEKDAAFASSLASTVLSHQWSNDIQAPTHHHSVYVTPVHTADAVATAGWVLQTLQTHPEYKTARSTLAHWAQSYESPKDLVLGIVGMAIIGPTLGIISSKKKKKRKSQLVIVDSYYSTLSKKELATLSTRLAQTVISQETRLVGGNVYNLHPDSAAWCIEEALTEIYVGTKNTVESLYVITTAEKLSHHSTKDAHGNLQTLIISPSVNDELVDESEAETI